MTGKNGNLHVNERTPVEKEATNPSERSENGNGLDKVVEDGQGIATGDKVGETHESTSEHERDPGS